MANMQVTVVDGNNVTVSLDRGVAGVGIASISLVVINQANYLLITYTNGTTQTVGPVGVIQYNATTPINISGSTISLLTVPVNLGGTGQTTANAGLNALLPVQTSQANKYLQTDGTNSSWDAISLSTADITGVLPVVNGGTGVGTSTGTGNTVLSTSPTLVTPVLGTPASGTLTNATGLPVATGISGLGTGIATFLATPSSANLAAALTDETGTGAAVFATSPTLVTPALGTPASGVMTNVTGTASGLTAGNVTTNANLTGMVTSVGNATTVVTNANLTGDVTSVGNATSIAAGVIVNADINASAAIDDTKLATIATASKVSNSATTAASANTASAIVARDASGNFTAGTVTAALTGNSSTATALATGRTISITGDLAYTSPTFDGTGNVTAAGTLATVATAGVTGSSTAIPVVTINAKGLTTSVTTAAVIAPAGTVTGNTLAAGVTGSSLTSLGTIANLSVTAGTISTTPSASTDIANKDYVDTVAQGLDPKASCVAATTANITLSGTQTIDGVALIAADRCLVKDQTAPAENGIYVVASGAWARAADMNVWLEVPGAFTFIEQGTLYADTGWVCTSNAGGTLGTTAITFVQFAGAGSYTASTGLTLTGTAFSLTAPVTVALGGTNATSAGITAFNNISGFTAAGATGTTSTNLVFSTSPTLVTPDLGTPSALVLTSATGLPLTTGVTGTLPVANGGTGLSSGTSGGVLAYTATGTLASSAALAASALVIGGGAGAAPSTTTTGTGVVTALGVNTGTAGAFVVNGGALGTPASGTLTNATGLPLTTGVTGTLPTANGGTNLTSFTSGGVVYASSSSALATGSALTFDGTNLGVSGNATLGWTGKLSFSYDTIGSYTKGLNSLSRGLEVFNYENDSNGGIRFILGTTAAPAEQMRLTSTGLGIGTSLPATKLEVSGTVASGVVAAGVTNTDTSGFSILRLRNTGASGRDYQIGVGGNTSGQNGNLYVFDATAGAVRAVLDPSGNLGLGVAPSAWGSPFLGAFEGKAGTALVGRSDAAQTFLFNNSYFNGTNYIRKAAGYANFILLDGFSGGMGFNIAGTSTAGSTASFTQAMTLDASGNLGIGTTSPAVRLHVANSGDNVSYFERVGGSRVVLYNASGDSFFGTTTNTPLRFATNDVERARIDSSGNLLVGTTSTIAGGKLSVSGKIAAINSGGAATLDCAQTGTTGDHIYFNTSTSTLAGFISSPTSTTTTYNSISDYRLKTVIGAVADSGSRIDALQPIEYEWKADGLRTRGFLAHQFQEVYANSVSGTKDAVDADGKPVYQAMQASTSEVIADLVAEIQSLRARVAQLESI